MPGLTEPNQVGKREDLADIVANVDQKSTPFTSRINKSKKPTNSQFDWQVDNYDDARTDGVIDGVDVADFENPAENRARIGNYAQEWRRTAKVSRRSEYLSDVAGVRSEIAKGIAKKIVELKRDTEKTLLSDNDGQADNGSVPYLTSGLGRWISTTGPTLPIAIPAAYRTPTAQIITTATASLTEDTDIQGMLAAIYASTGMNGDFVLFAEPALRRRFTDMTRTIANTTSTATKVRSFSQSASSSKVTNTTTVYEGDFGTIEIVADNFMPETGRGYVVDMNRVHLRSHSTPTAERLPDLGGGPRVLVSAIAGLQVDNPLGLGGFNP